MSDYVPQPIYAKLFLDDQGYGLKENIVYQDNQSLMKLEKSGRISCGQKSWHINIHFFWVTDCVKSGDITIEYCPTEIMLADSFTKPLQGFVFHRFRDFIMGWKTIESLDESGPIGKKGAR